MDFFQSHSTGMGESMKRWMCGILIAISSGLAWADTTSVADRASGVEKNWYPSLGIGVPDPLSLSVTWNQSAEWSYVGGVGFMYVPLSSDRSILYLSAQASVQWHPFWDAFYIGVEGGAQSVGLKNLFPSSFAGTTLTSGSVMTFQNIFVCPLVGAEWKWPSGWRVVLEGGWQLPLVSWGGVVQSGNASFESASQRSLGAIAGTPLPSFAFRVGKTF